MSVTSLKKVPLNFGYAALTTLGSRQYARLLASLIRALPSVAKDRSLRTIDATMGRTPVHITFRGQTFVIDCPQCDAATPDMGDASFAFGLIRELFVRNCYLRAPYLHLGPGDTVVDCGANRGIFTVYAASVADKVVAVEPSRTLMSLVTHHVRLNNLDNVITDQVFVGDARGADRGPHASDVVSMPELFERHDLARIDLLKVDVEGSEFSLFEDDGWLRRVRGIAMELHQQAGDVRPVARALERHGFRLEFRSADLRRVRDLGAASFLYAGAK